MEDESKTREQLMEELLALCRRASGIETLESEPAAIMRALRGDNGFSESEIYSGFNRVLRCLGEKEKNRFAFEAKTQRSGVDTDAPFAVPEQHWQELFFANRPSPLEKSEEIARGSYAACNPTGHDRTEERLIEYQERLRSLASELSLAEERERKRIAAELHDHIAQPLIASNMMLETVKKSILSPDDADSLDKIRRLIEQTIRDVRTLTFEVSPPILYMVGIEAALEWLVEKNQEQTGIMAEFDDDGQPKPLDEDIRVLLFQAVRELLTNVAKHSQASKMKVTIRRTHPFVNIVIEDDGIGFDPSTIGSCWDESGGFGLFNIRERLDYLGGHFKIASRPHGGTRITLLAPLKAESEAVREVLA
ncbi:MAG: sensor histidine kinase [Candidatus Abyssubacteria bacterium]|nr:sensor histidine kinase [Candidatus Abyssubacteria bacterium]